MSEHRIGRMLRDPGKTGSILSTKVGRVLYAPPDLDAFLASERVWPHGLNLEFRHDYTYDGVMRSFEDSLQRLGLPRIDALLIHDLEVGGLIANESELAAHMKALETGGIRALEELKKSGHIAAIGAGVNHHGTITRFLDAIDLDFFLVAGPYTLLDQQVLVSEFPLCVSRGVGVVVGQVFASGILATGPTAGAWYNYQPASPEVMERVRQIELICRNYAVPLPAAALQFPLGHPAVAAVIPGAFTPEQATRNVEFMRLAIPSELWGDLRANGLLADRAPTPG